PAGIAPAIRPVDFGAGANPGSQNPSLVRNDINQNPAGRVDQPFGLRADTIPGLRTVDNGPTSRFDQSGRPIEIATRLPESLRAIEPGPVRTIESTIAGLKGGDPLSRIDLQNGKLDQIRITIAGGNDVARAQDIVGRRTDITLPVVLGQR